MAGRFAVVGGLALLVAGVLAVRTASGDERSVDLATFSHHVSEPGVGAEPFSERSIVGTLAYELATVTSGRIDDFWARVDDGDAMGLLTLHRPGRPAQAISVQVIDTSRAGSGSATPCRAGPRCAVSTVPAGGTLAMREGRHGAGGDAVLTDPRHHVVVELATVDTVRGLLTSAQIAAVVQAPWWRTGAPREVASASRRLKVSHIGTATAVRAA